MTVVRLLLAVSLAAGLASTSGDTSSTHCLQSRQFNYIKRFCPVEPAKIPPVKLHVGTRIVGGYPVNITQVPWQISLHHRKWHICGGSIISDQWILTAAHCVDDVVSDHRVRVGSLDKLTGGTLHYVDQAIRHEKYTGLYDYDFGLIKLRSKLRFDDSVRSVRLPKIGANDITTGTMCLVSGWGDTRNVSETSRYLRAVQVPRFDQDVCNQRYKGQVTARMFCAGYENGGKDSETCNTLLQFIRNIEMDG